MFEERNLLKSPVQPNPAAMKLCPYCSKEMELAAIVCQQCGRDWKTGVSQWKTAAPQDRSSPSPPALTKGETLAGVYLLVVAAALLVEFGSSDRTLSHYVGALAIYLTMPLSLVGTGLFAWSLIHGGSAGPMVAMLAIAGLVNAFFIAWLVDRSPGRPSSTLRNSKPPAFHAPDQALRTPGAPAAVSRHDGSTKGL